MLYIKQAKQLLLRTKDINVWRYIERQIKADISVNLGYVTK